MKKRFLAVTATLALAAVSLLAVAAPASASQGAPSFENHCFIFAQPNVIVGSGNADILPGSDCNDIIYGLSGDDRLIGNDGRDILYGGLGNDRLFGVDGHADQLWGGRGRDICRGDQFDRFFGCEVAIRVAVPVT